MSRIPSIRIRYCGGCNPEIDRSETVSRVKNHLGKKVLWTQDPNEEADVILHVCGCAHACIDEESASPQGLPVVSIQGRRIDRKEAPAGKLAVRAAQKLAETAGKCTRFKS